mmetsp:Transcript_7316/g.17842  ORF Transcript_7316/g.17842 Transcript_7316/m.17842 type:complete len:231 (+) Transcript_7316:836-1528(+)
MLFSNRGRLFEGIDGCFLVSAAANIGTWSIILSVSPATLRPGEIVLGDFLALLSSSEFRPALNRIFTQSFCAPLIKRLWRYAPAFGPFFISSKPHASMLCKNASIVPHAAPFSSLRSEKYLGRTFRRMAFQLSTFHASPSGSHRMTAPLLSVTRSLSARTLCNTVGKWGISTCATGSAPSAPIWAVLWTLEESRSSCVVSLFAKDIDDGPKSLESYDWVRVLADEGLLLS